MGVNHKAGNGIQSVNWKLHQSKKWKWEPIKDQEMGSKELDLQFNRESEMESSRQQQTSF
jgi:hypothetical protein